MTPALDEPQVFSRPSFIPLSGHSSPTGFPFYGSGASNSPRTTPTPTGQYNGAQDAFNFYHNRQQPTNGPGNGNVSGYNDNTPRASPNGVNISPPNGLVAAVNGMREHDNGKNAIAKEILDQIQPGYKVSPADTQAWTKQLDRDGSPSIAAT